MRIDPPARSRPLSAARPNRSETAVAQHLSRSSPRDQRRCRERPARILSRSLAVYQWWSGKGNSRTTSYPCSRSAVKNRCGPADALPPPRHGYPRQGATERPKRFAAVRYAEHWRPLERSRDPSHVFIGPRHEKAIRRARGIEPFAQSAARQHSLVEIGCRHHQHVDLSTERQMLKPIVEQQDGALQLALGQSPGEISIGTDEDGYIGKRPRQHLRFVPRALHRYEHARAVAHHDDAIVRSGGARSPGSESRGAHPTRAACGLTSRRPASCHCRQRRDCLR